MCWRLLNIVVECFPLCGAWCMFCGVCGVLFVGCCFLLVLYRLLLVV